MESTLHRNVTAIYRTHATADLVRRELAALGIAEGEIRVIPDRDEPVGTDGERDDSGHMDALHDLQLPDDDLRTYQSSVRRGDYIVSVEVDDEHVGKAQEIMRRPEDEAYNLDTRDTELAGEQLRPRTAGAATAPDERRLARRDPAHSDPYSRTYDRDDRIEDPLASGRRPDDTRKG